jgi:hypothetical protein
VGVGGITSFYGREGRVGDIFSDEIKGDAMSENTNAIVERGFMNPTSLKEGMEMAAWIAKSDLAPRDYKDKPQNVLLAMQMGFELGLSPMQAIQNIAVINGRPSIWGDAMLGICQNHRDFESIDENQSTNEKGVCIVKRRGMEPQTRIFTVQDAQKAGLWGKAGPWQTAPTRMLKLRARAFALRDTFADALRGLQSAEEQRDVVETTATVSPISDVQMPKRASAPLEPIETNVPEAVSQSTPALTTHPTTQENQKTISFPQGKRFFAIAKGAAKTDEEIKAYLAVIGVTKTIEMPVEKYDAACEWAGKKADVVNTATGEIETETPGVGE